MITPIKQESIFDMLGAPKGKRQADMYEYALNLLRRDLSHIQLQADMRGANSHALKDLLDEVSQVLSYYKN